MNRIFIRFCGTILAIFGCVISRANANTWTRSCVFQSQNGENIIYTKDGVSYYGGCEYSDNLGYYFIPYGALPEYNCGGGSGGSGSGSTPSTGGRSGSTSTSPETGICAATTSIHCNNSGTAYSYYCLDDGNWNKSGSCTGPKGEAWARCDEYGIIADWDNVNKIFAGHTSGILQSGSYSRDQVVEVSGMGHVWLVNGCVYPKGFDSTTSKGLTQNDFVCVEIIGCPGGKYIIDEQSGVIYSNDYKGTAFTSACAKCPTLTTPANAKNITYSIAGRGITACRVSYTENATEGTYRVTSCPYTK